MNLAAATSANNLVRISTDSLEMIADPVVELLNLMHSLIRITESQTIDFNQTVDHKRRLVAKFRDQLFANDSNGLKIKSQLRKVC